MSTAVLEELIAEYAPRTSSCTLSVVVCREERLRNLFESLDGSIPLTLGGQRVGWVRAQSLSSNAAWRVVCDIEDVARVAAFMRRNGGRAYVSPQAFVDYGAGKQVLRRYSIIERSALVGAEPIVKL